MVATAPENVHYVTNYWSISNEILRTAVVLALIDGNADLRAVVIPCSDVASFVAGGFKPELLYPYGLFFFEGGAEASVVQELIQRADASPAQALSRALADTGLDQGKIGVDEGQLPASLLPQLQSLVPDSSFSYANDAFREARLVKSPEEVRKLERAAEIAEDALFAALQQVGPGTTEKELAQQYELEVVRRGGRPFFTVVTFGERAAFADTPPTHRALRPGDMLRFDLGAIFEGYRSDIARTAVLGEPSAKVASYYAAMLTGADVAIAAAKPGVKAKDVFEQTVEAVRQAGVGHYRRHHVGHAIGLEVYDALSVAPGVETVLEAGMVLCLETPYYELGWGGVQVEDLVHITEQGATLLNKSRRDLVVLPL